MYRNEKRDSPNDTSDGNRFNPDQDRVEFLSSERCTRTRWYGPLKCSLELCQRRFIIKCTALHHRTEERKGTLNVTIRFKSNVNVSEEKFLACWDQAFRAHQDLSYLQSNDRKKFYDPLDPC